MKVRLSLIVVTVLALLGPVLPVAAQGEHLVLGFYYNWYDEKSFGPKKTSDQPVTPYKSSDRATIERHVDQAKQAGLDGFIVSWYGPRDAPDNQTEANLRTLLDVAQEKGFRVAVDFETGGPFFKRKNDVQAALASLLSTHASHPAYLKVNGKPVVFFWQNSRFSVNDWTAIDEDEVKTGHQRAGMYFGMGGFVITFERAARLNRIRPDQPAFGYDTLLDVQPATVDLGFRIFLTVPTSIGFLLAIFLLWLYPLHGKRLQEIRDTLKAKRGEAQ